MKTLLLLSTVFIISSATAQVYTGGGAGLMKDKFAAQFYVGYGSTYQIEAGYIGKQFTKGAYFNLNAGYSIEVKGVSIRPGIIGALYHVGNRSRQDRYKDQVLSSGHDVNSSYMGGSLRISGEMFYTEVGYLNGAFVVFGMRYSFK